MKSYGLTMQGRLIIEQTQSKPIFTSQDVGRIIHVIDEDAYYLGGNNKWIALNTANKINAQYLDFGLGEFQINATHIPVVNTKDFFVTASSVNSALEQLAIGDAIQDKSINSRCLVLSSIGPQHISWGYEKTQISAKDLPIINQIMDPNFTPIKMTLQEAFDYFATYLSLVVRKTIQLNSWSYDMNSEEYFATIYISPIKSPTVVVQCYDVNGQAVVPSRIDTQLTGGNRRVTIWSPYKLILNTVIVG